MIQDYLSAIPEVSSAEAASLGASSGSDLAKSIHDKLCSLTADKWSIIAPLAEMHPYWLLEANDEKLRQRRALLGTLFQKTDTDLAQLEDGAEFVNLKTRVSALFDLAEKCGLFFCRMGTIECNYYSEILTADFDKPQAATEEASTIADTAVEAVSTQYSDVVRCIQFASNVEKICEAEALQDLLLSVAAPAQSRLIGDSSDGDLNALARQTIGERAALFQVTKKNGNVEIDVSSKILDVADCFPIIVGKDENVVSAIGKALKLES